MDMKLWAETAGFAAVAGGPGCSVVLPEALGGLTHRYAGRVALAVVAGREMSVREHCGALALAPGALAGSSTQGARGLLAVGGPSTGSVQRGLAAVGTVADQGVAACVNGCVFNAAALRGALVERGALMASGGYAELLLHLMAQSRQRTLVNRLVEALERIVGGFSLVVVAEEVLVAARDPRGFRPLWIGARSDTHLVASDRAALLAMGAKRAREVSPGEVVLLEPKAPARSLRPWGVFPRAACVQEWLCFARVGASFDGLPVHALRQRLGRALAASCPAPCDAVVHLPGDCAVAAMAFAHRSSLPLEQAFDGAPGSDPAWPAPQALRAVRSAVRGRRLALVWAPGTPLERLRDAVTALLGAGARQVHLRCIAPLQTLDCPFGQDLPPPLLAAGSGLDLGALQAWLQVDTLASLGLDALATALGREATGCCAHCLGGPAPLLARDAAATPQLPLFQGGPPGTEDARLV